MEKEQREQDWRVLSETEDAGLGGSGCGEGEAVEGRVEGHPSASELWTAARSVSAVSLYSAGNFAEFGPCPPCLGR